MHATRSAYTARPGLMISIGFGDQAQIRPLTLNQPLQANLTDIAESGAKRMGSCVSCRAAAAAGSGGPTHRDTIWAPVRAMVPAGMPILQAPQCRATAAAIICGAPRSCSDI